MSLELGTSMAGFAVKKSTGVMCSSMISTGLILVRFDTLWKQNRTQNLDSHHWPIFNARIMRQAKYTPDDDILLEQVLVSGHHIGDAVGLSPA